MNRSDLGRLLREMREASGNSQRALGELLGLSQGYVTKAEAGKVGIDIEEIERWAEACGTHAVLRFASKDLLAADAALAILSGEDQALVARVARALSKAGAGRMIVVAELGLVAEAVERATATAIVDEAYAAAAAQREKLA